MPAEPHYPSLSNLRRIWNSRLCWFRTPTKLQALSGGRFGGVGVVSAVSRRPPVRHGALALIS